MATFKHISSKNADYGAAEQYLTFEHDEFTMKPMNVSMTRTKYATSALIFIIALSARLTCPKNKPDLSDTLRKCRIGTAKFFTLLLLLYHT